MPAMIHRSYNMADVHIVVQITKPAWAVVPNADALAGQAAMAAIHASAKHRRGEMTICLSNDAVVQALNKQYRNKDKPTNVLAFPPAPIKIHEGPVSLGDVIIAFETAQTQAHGANKSLRVHLCHLIIHGVLHLLGYTHQNDSDSAIMEALEQRALRRLFGTNNGRQNVA